MGLPQYTGRFAFPGMSDVVESVENEFGYGPANNLFLDTALVDGAARDAGNTGATDSLRVGLLMGRRTSDGKLLQWNPTASNGTEKVYGVLAVPMHMVENAANQDRFFSIARWGTIKVSRIIIPGETDFGVSGKDYEYLAVAGLLEAGFLLGDQDYQFDFKSHANVASTSTLAATMAGKLITDNGASGNTTITLPDPRPGLNWRFGCVTTNTRTIAIASANQITHAGGATGTSVALAGFGAVLELTGVEVGTDSYQYLVTEIIDGTVS